MNPSPKTFYPMAKPWITEDEIRNVTEVLRSGQLSLGPKVAEFEAKFAAYIGVRYAAAVSSGTAGLHLCMRLLNLQEGDEIITSPLSFIASANSILYERAIPRFVDIDPKTLNLDPALIEQAVTPRTRSILAVHIFGYPADLEAINRLARKHGLSVIEDGCEALGATYHKKKVGTFGNPTVFAFYANKQMTTAEGGVVVTDDPAVHQKIKSLSNQGRAIGDQWLQHEDLGYNYRLSDIHCAIGLGQLERLEHMLAERRAIARRYNELLQDIEELELVDLTLPEERSWFIYLLWARNSLNRNTLIQALHEHGVSSRAYFPTIHLQPYYRNRFGYRPGAFPVAEDKASRSLALPFYVGLTEADLQHISQVVHQTVAQLLKEGKIYA